MGLEGVISGRQQRGRRWRKRQRRRRQQRRRRLFIKVKNEWQRGKSPTTSTAAGFKLETARASNQDTVPLSRRTIFHCKNADSGSNAEQKTVWSRFFFNVNTLKCHFRERSSLSTTRRRSRCWWSGWGCEGGRTRWPRPACRGCRCTAMKKIRTLHSRYLETCQTLSAIVSFAWN